MRSLEFMNAARLITDYYLGIKPGEDVLVVRDTRISEFPGADALVEAVLSSISLGGGEPQVINYVSRPMAGMEPPKIVAAAMKSADAVIIMSTLSILQTVATTEAISSGTRVLMLPPARYIYNSLDMLYRLMPTDSKEIDERIKLAEKLSTIFGAGSKVKVTSPKGTSMILGIGKLKVLFNPTTVREPGLRTIVPGGQVAAGVTVGEAEGKFVVDGSASPMYRPLSDPIEMVVKEGKVVEINGGRDAQEYREFLEKLGDPQVYVIAEVGIGFHPRARLTGTPLEDERIFGASWIAVGTNVHLGGTVKAKIHSDCVMLPPVNLVVDDKPVLKDGKFCV
jgi:leucyl aminopeptidase (aminopeptidase T)